MYTLSKLTGKIYNTISGVEIIQDDTLNEWQQFNQWKISGGIVNVVNYFGNELQDQEYLISKEKVLNFLNNNKTEGKKFFDDMHVRITMELSAIERNILFPILEEIDNLLYPPLNKIKTGDFASALWIFCGQPDPENQFVLDFYDEAFAYCQEYYNTKYPK